MVLPIVSSSRGHHADREHRSNHHRCSVRSWRRDRRYSGAKGARVFGLDLDFTGAAEIDGVTYLSTDVTDENQVRSAVSTAAESGPLRIAVNCAGIAPSARMVRRNGIHDLGLYAKVVKVNLLGTFTVLTLTAQEIAKTESDKEGQRGVIVNTASVAAYEGQIGQAAYVQGRCRRPHPARRPGPGTAWHPR